MVDVSDRGFYRELARRLRTVDARVTERADRTRADAEANGAVSLADINDYLTSSDGAAFLETMNEAASRAVAHTRAALEAKGHRSTMGASLHGVDDVYPADAFEKRLVEFFDARNGFFGSPTVERAALPAAVTTALSSAVDRTGMLTEEGAGRLGPLGVQLLQHVRGRIGARSDRPSAKYEELGVVQAKIVARSRRTPPAKDRMPVLDAVTKAIGGPDALAGFTMASVQHLFSSTRGLYAALADNGLATATTSVGGKGYSTNMDTMMRLQAVGFDVHPDGRVLAHGAHASAEVVTGAMAKAQLGALFAGVDPKEAKPRFLLLDEGAKLIQALHLHYPQFAHLCVCVEQTDRGLQIIDAAKKAFAEEEAIFESTGAWPEPRRGWTLACPVVDMARSEAKKTWESPMIGESCVFNLEHGLGEMNEALRAKIFDDPARKSACIIGYGAVGRAVAERLLARGFEVHVHDTDPEAMRRAARDGCVPASREDAIAAGHVFYGCTGGGVLEPSEYDLLPDGAVLANAASGNHELGLAGVDIDGVGNDHHQRIGDDRATSRFLGLDVNLGEADDPMRHRVWRTPSGKELLLARSGYVVNMGLDIPPEYAQLIRSLLLASCLTASRATEPGLVAIPKDVQRFVVARVQRELSKKNLSLERPDFRRLDAWA